MPRAFTQEEREKIRADLSRAARRTFARDGYTGATVASIARSAGIGKGTFYLFFESKAALFAVSTRRSMVGEGAYEQVAETLVSALAAELTPE